MPQILMLNHAAWVNRENTTRLMDAKYPKDDSSISTPEIRSEQERINKMEPVELSDYMRSIAM